MGIDLDKHDLFRNGVPGFVFLFTLFSFYYANNNFILQTGDDISTFLSVMVIAITLPTGYLIHNVYRGLHIFSELERWERNEADMLRLILNTEQLANLTAGDLQRDKQISWFIESCLHVKSSEPIRERGYQLISRIHSLGGSMIAISGGVVLSIGYLSYRNILLERWQIFVLISFFWILIILLLNLARTSTFTNYQILIRHFINIRQKWLREIAAREIDPFAEEKRNGDTGHL